MPTTMNLELETSKRRIVSANPEVRIMTVKFLAQLGLLVADRFVPIESTPLGDFGNRPRETAR